MKKILTFSIFCVFKICLCQTYKSNEPFPITRSIHTYKVIKRDSLKLDFYKPENIDKKLPLIVFVHGGGFASGKRDESHIVKFCSKISGYGFAVASISYRLTMKNVGLGCNVKAKDKLKAFNSASEDISYAVKFLINQKQDFNIDTNKVILVGNSSGAEAILNLVYNFKNKILPKKFKFGGVISMTGALVSLSGINAETAIPTQLFHGTNDSLVPYYIAAHHFCNEDDPGYLILYGSRAIADRLKGLGLNYFLISYIAEPHQRSSAPLFQNFDDILDFINNDVLKANLRQTERTFGF